VFFEVSLLALLALNHKNMTKVALRKKKISKGRESLYLDYYPPIKTKEGRETRREFLGLYVYDKPKNTTEKSHNVNTQGIAEGIRARRENELNKPEIYNPAELEQLKRIEMSGKSFLEYFRTLAEKRETSNRENWVSTLMFLEDFSGGIIKFSDLTESYIEKFRAYLLTAQSKRGEKPLAQNTAASYFNKLKTALRQAHIDGYLQTDVSARIAAIKTAETNREHLTLEELNSLAKTPCNFPILKRAALFSALTGLRFSDIQKMTWNEIEYEAGRGYFLKFTQQKTQKLEVLPISEQAYSFTEGKENPKEMPQGAKVFEGLNYSAHLNRHLYQWIGAAGITKNITFHCFRHTFATLQLSEGTDIYTVSKMLGHKSVQTTQVYAKVVEESKRKAADKIRLEL